MKFHQIFRASLSSPKKLAAFRIMPVGKTFSYVFFFVFVFTLISFIRFLVGDPSSIFQTNELIEQQKKLGMLLYPVAFILQLVISTMFIFITLSIMAWVGGGLLNLQKRRWTYLQIWRTAAFSMTVPILLMIVFDFFPSLTNYVLPLVLIVHFYYIARATRYFPKRPLATK